MALKRLKYGVEYVPEDVRRDGDGPSGYGWILVLVLLAAAASFVVTVVRRISSEGETSGGAPETFVVSAEPSGAPAPTPKMPDASRPLAADAAPSPAPQPSAGGEVRSLVVTDFASRSTKVRNLLLRLEEASKKGDLEMQVSTIERLRALPGDPVADIDDALVDKLGEMNLRWLYELKNPQWVTEATVRRGDSATRLAHERGATLGSLRKLNPGVDADKLRVGQKISIMDHPRFSLTVRNRLRTVDLNLNGKLFKRYRLPDDAPDFEWESGVDETPANLKGYLRGHGVLLKPEEAAELDELVPRGTPVRISAS